MPGKTKIVETGHDTTILLDADAGKVAVGGASVDGSVEVITGGHVVGVLRAQPQIPANPQRPRQPPSGGLIELSKPDGKPPQIVLNAGTGSVRAPLFNAINDEGKTTVRVDGDEATITAGGEHRGKLHLKDSLGHTAVSIDTSWMKLGIPEEDRTNNELLPSYGVYVYNTAGKTSAFLDGVAGRFNLGTPTEGDCKIEMDSRQGLVKLGLSGRNSDDRPIELEGDAGLVTLGCSDRAGAVHVRDAESRTSIKLDGASGQITLGTNGRDGDLIVTDQEAREVLHIDGATAAIRIGTNGHGGDLVITNDAGRDVCHIDGKTAAMRIGSISAPGEFLLEDAQGRIVVRADASSSTLYLGTNGRDGDLVVTDDAGRDVCHIDGKTAAMRIGSTGAAGAFLLEDAQGRVVVRLDGDAASVGVGSSGHAGQIKVRKSDGTDSIQIDGESGDILLSNADCAEEFDFAASQVDPGTVVVIDEDERLAMSTLAYDTRVAGVVSGAGRYRPAIVLDRRQGGVTRPAVAMVGKVECRVDAEHGPIRCGDLLVSSPTPGHAMAAKDRGRAMGAVLGKALRSMDQGQGLIPILVCLQ